jgi:putative two-component system response regulator
MHRTPAILIADDDEQALSILEQILRGQGYDVFAYREGATARDAVFEEKPDLVIVDNYMPGMSGIEVCREVKQHRDTRMIPVIMLTGYSESQEKLEAIEAGVDDFVNKPFKVMELTTRIKSLLRVKFMNEEIDSAEGVIFALAGAIEAKDAYTQGHTERVSQLALGVGHLLGLSEEDENALYKGGILHDIGKIAIPDAILNKPGRLSDDEMITIRTHPDRGERICKPLNSMKSALSVIRYHHERLDGSGYPDHLSGNQIPVIARIMAIVDIYDALTSARAYRAALPQSQAFSILDEEAARGWWDTTILSEFKRIVAAP